VEGKSGLPAGVESAYPVGFQEAPEVAMDDGVEPGDSTDSPKEDFVDPTKSMELVWQGQGGDPQAVNELLARYIPRMRRVLNIKIDKWQRSRVDPEDVLQETMMVATARFNDFEVRTSASILQWLAKIADLEIKNRLEYMRAEKRDPARERRIRSDEDSDASTSGVIVPFEGPTASQFYARQELEQTMDAELQALDPPDYREVILMRDYYDADWESICTALGRPNAESVQDLYYRAHKRLRERMSKYLE